MKNNLDALVRQKDRLLKVSLRDIVSAVGPFTLLLLILLALAYYYIDPAPPHHIVIVAGREDSDYHEFAASYRDILAEDNIALEIRQSEGTLENLSLLKDDSSGVDIAFVLDGLHVGEEADVLSLGSISYEPLWIFYRDRMAHNRLSDFAKKKIAIGKNGSGAQMLTLRLLGVSGISPENATFVSSTQAESIALFERGQVDALSLLGQPDSPEIKKLLNAPGVRAMDFDQAEAYTRRFPFLHSLLLPHGSIDLYRNIPSQDIHLLATTSTVAIRDSLHPAIVSLLMKAMNEVHSGPSLLHGEHAFPGDKDVDFDLSPDAQRYYKSGPPFLQRYLPFWLATLIDRIMLVAIPLMAILIPLSRTIPQVYRWRIKRRINCWYRELVQLEVALQSNRDYTEHLRKLDWIDAQSSEVPVPLAFSDSAYVLKEHIELVRQKILRLRDEFQGNAKQA